MGRDKLMSHSRSVLAWKGGNPLDMDFDVEGFTCTGLASKYSKTGVWKSCLCEEGAVPPNDWHSSTSEQQLFWHCMLISVWVFADECDTCIQNILLLLLLPKVMDQLETLKCTKSLGLR